VATAIDNLNQIINCRCHGNW